MSNSAEPGQSHRETKEIEKADQTDVETLAQFMHDGGGRHGQKQHPKIDAAGERRAVAEKQLHLSDENRQGSLNDEEPHHRADRGDRIIAPSEQPHVDRRMLFAKLPDDEARQRQDHHDQCADQDRRVEPVEVVAHVENRLQP